jgi:hypothetical protein
MKYFLVFGLSLLFLGLAADCGTKTAVNQNVAAPPPATATPVQPVPSPTSPFPDLQAELLNKRDKSTSSPIGSFDFKNFTYELPRGWQNPDGTADIVLTNGRVTPIEGKFSDEMTDEEKIAARAQRRIGMSYITTKYFDVTGDGQDEAVVILKVETGGAAIPQLVYIFSWKDGHPILLWAFRTGDRADGGLKDLRQENGMLLVELYGQDRFLLGQVETRKVTGDEEQLCCPTFFTRSVYKWNGTSFLMQGKRLTYPISEPNGIPEENLGDRVNAPAKPKK